MTGFMRLEQKRETGGGRGRAGEQAGRLAGREVEKTFLKKLQFRKALLLQCFSKGLFVKPCYDRVF